MSILLIGEEGCGRPPRGVWGAYLAGDREVAEDVDRVGRAGGTGWHAHDADPGEAAEAVLRNREQGGGAGDDYRELAGRVNCLRHERPRE